jgi:calcium-dependent protein kinase
MYSFDGREWEVVTEAAKDMITQMLVLEYSKRATAKHLLAHRRVAGQGSSIGKWQG